MFKAIQAFRQASAKTKWFYFNFVIYMLLIIFTTIFCYLRLDYVRSYGTQTSQKQE